MSIKKSLKKIVTALGSESIAKQTDGILDEIAANMSGSSGSTGGLVVRTIPFEGVYGIGSGNHFDTSVEEIEQAIPNVWLYYGSEEEAYYLPLVGVDKVYGAYNDDTIPKVGLHFYDILNKQQYIYVSSYDLQSFHCNDIINS